MKNEEINLAIKKALHPILPYDIEESYEDHPHWDRGFYVTTVRLDKAECVFYKRKSEITAKDLESAFYDTIKKDYCSDLNAMHEAEKTLVGEQCLEYINQLFALNFKGDQNPDSFFGQCTATAAHRAEAFLRTIEKWEESNDSSLTGGK